MIRHAKACYPWEGCGLLAGQGNQAARFIPMENCVGSESEYEMEPQQLIQTLWSLRENGEQLVAIYNSHQRGAAKPSRRDIERAYYPEAAYLIVSLADLERPEVRGFRITEGEATEIEVHVIV